MCAFSTIQSSVHNPAKTMPSPGKRAFDHCAVNSVTTVSFIYTEPPEPFVISLTLNAKLQTWIFKKKPVSNFGGVFSIIPKEN